MLPETLLDKDSLLEVLASAEMLFTVIV